MKKSTALSASLLLAVAGSAVGQVQHGTINVTENDAGNTPASVTLTRVGGAGPWVTVSDTLDQSNRGDYVVDFATGSDQNLGVLITGVAQTQRSEPSVPFPQYFATTASARSSAGFGRYFIAVFEAPSGGEVNYNPSLAYFPIADGWIAGDAFNAENNGPLTTIIGNPNIQLRDENTATGAGVELIDSTADVGRYVLSIDGIDLRRDGVVIASGAKNEDNRAGVFLNYDGRAVIHCIDNGSEGGGENDAAGFVFIPQGTQGVVMGDITGSGRTLFGQGDFTVELVGQPDTNGTYRLTIAGESPETGTLIVVPHTELSGATVDNPVFTRAEGDSWIITSMDTEPNPPAGTGMVLQDVGSNVGCFVFAFFKNGVDIVPGTPSRNYLERLDDVVAARFQVTEFTPNNGVGDMRADRVAGSDALGVSGDNKGDVGISYLGARLAAFQDNALDTYEGLVLGNTSGFIRDNSATGGVSGWATFSFDNGEARTHVASLAGSEINSDFALALFPTSLGFTMAADVALPDGRLGVPVAGNAATDGVMMANNWDNTNRIIAATPNGQQYDLVPYEAAGGFVATDSVEVGYIYLPYNTENLIAGQVAADGSVLSGTKGFSIGLGVDELYAFNVFTLTIPGVDARTDGVLLLTATAGAHAFSWEPGPNGEFEIAALDLATETPVLAPFAFAYIPFEGLGGPVDTCAADFNDDTLVNSQDFFDFLTAFFATAPNADFNHDAVVNSQDFFDFLTSFFAGC
jgi:hypothetical protein